MRWLILMLCLAGFANGSPTEDFIDAAKVRHGEAGEKAARFLVENMPARDRETLSTDFLARNLDLAFQARAEFPWAREIPEELFLNDVLPYAVFDESRESWRAGFLEKAGPLVKDAKTATEAVQALNRGFFNLVNVHYHTGRDRPNQSPAESIATGKATCTGLSILLVDACRAIGIPARAVGTAAWTHKPGNHTWVEIWDGGWHFTGADEYDPHGLNRGWFVEDAAHARADDPAHAIYATSWKKDGTTFPLVWAAESRDVPAVNVTARYAKPEDAKSSIAIRLLSGEGPDSRIAAKGWLTTADGQKLAAFETKAGRADLNDMARVGVVAGTACRLRFELNEISWETLPFTAADGPTTRDIRRGDLHRIPDAIARIADGKEPNEPLSKDDATRATGLIYQQLVENQRAAREAELQAKSIAIDGKNLRWLEKTFGEPPAGGRSLWISLHGGGNAPPAVNDSQWQNQIRLYQPEEGIYLAPRAPTDTWNLWHESHIDPLLDRLIENHVALRGMDPDKVYLMGYSAGGDGVWQLAPRMADRFAAAAMMAGHPNEASLSGLRNLPFAIFMGGADAAYDRNKIAAERAAELDRLEKDDPGGYVHFSRIYDGLPHWMNGKDAEALPWMIKFKRRAWPDKIVWFQDDRLHDRFYWIKIPDTASAKPGQQIIATVNGQTIVLNGDIPAKTELRLTDELLDLDQPVKVIVNGKPAATVQVERLAANIRKTLEERADPSTAATGILTLR